MAADLGENERRETLLEQLKRQLREEEERQQEEQRAQAERQQLLLCVPQAEAQLQALRQQLQQQEHRADAERQRADAERQRAEAEQRRLLERALRAELQLEAVRQELQQLQQQHQQQEKKGQWEAGEALGGQRAPLAAVNVNDQHVGGQERLLHLSPLSRQLRAMQLGRQQQQQQRRAETDGEQLERALHADAPMQQLEAARCRGGPSGRSHQSTRGYGGEELAFSRADRAGGSREARSRNRRLPVDESEEEEEEEEEEEVVTRRRQPDGGRGVSRAVPAGPGRGNGRVDPLRFDTSSYELEQPEEEVPVGADRQPDWAAHLQRECRLLGPREAATSMVRLPDGSALHVPLAARLAASRHQGLEPSQVPNKDAAPLGEVMMLWTNAPVDLEGGKEALYNLNSGNYLPLLTLARTGAAGRTLQPTAAQLKAMLHQMTPKNKGMDGGIRQGQGWVGGLDTVTCATFRGTESADGSEVCSLLARRSSSQHSRWPVRVIRVAALASAQARTAFREVTALLVAPDDNLYRQLQTCVVECAGADVWSQLAAQDAVDLVVVEVDFHGSLAGGEHAVARRALMLRVPKPAQGPTAASGGAAAGRAAGPSGVAARPQLVWGEAQVLVGQEAPPLPAFAAGRPRAGRGPQEPQLLSATVGK